MREKSRIGDALGAVFGAKLGVTEVTDPGTRCISRTRTLLNMAWRAHGLGFYEKPIWPSPWARAHGPTIATTGLKKEEV